ncbi:MAG: hypothetical protein HQK96_13525 [Nitrospirae bacterium]|nr:hypothetical protein [Nitrospirota bacterium]
MSLTIDLSLVKKSLYDNAKEEIIKDYGLQGNYNNPEELSAALLDALRQTPAVDPLAEKYSNYKVFEAAARSIGSNARKWSTFVRNEGMLCTTLHQYNPSHVVMNNVQPATIMCFLPGQSQKRDSEGIVAWANILNNVQDYYSKVIIPVAHLLRESVGNSLTIPHLMLYLVAFFGSEPGIWRNSSIISALRKILPASLMLETPYNNKWKFKGMMYALGAEFLRNLGWSGFKVDRHIMRLFKLWLQNNNVDDTHRDVTRFLECFHIDASEELRSYIYYSMLGMKMSPQGIEYSHVDNLVWALGAYVEKKGKESGIRYLN